MKLALRHHNEPRLVYNWVATHQAPGEQVVFLDDSFVMFGWVRSQCPDYDARLAIRCLPVYTPEAMVKLH